MGVGQRSPKASDEAAERLRALRKCAGF